MRSGNHRRVAAQGAEVERPAVKRGVEEVAGLETPTIFLD
jgi:hypothetical protein